LQQDIKSKIQRFPSQGIFAMGWGFLYSLYSGIYICAVEARMGFSPNVKVTVLKDFVPILSLIAFNQNVADFPKFIGPKFPASNFTDIDY
jgi:hypothetical protein